MTQPPASPRRLAIGGMIALAVAMGIGRFVYTPILPGMMGELGLSASQAGLIASANYLGYLVGAVAAAGGWAHGRERAVMAAGLLSSAALAAAMAASDAVPVFLIVRFMAGLASAFVMVFSTTIIFSHLAAIGRTDLQAGHFGGVGLGIAVSALMTAALVLSSAPWWQAWLWSGLLSLVGSICVLPLVDRGPANSKAAVREGKLPASRALRRVIFAYGLFGFGYIVTATFLIAIVREGEAGRLAESYVWLATGLAGIPSVLVWNRVARRFGLRAAYAAGCFVESVGVVASVSLGGFAGPLVGGILLGGTFIAITALGLQAGARLAPDAPRRTLAVMTASFGVGQILGPLFAGYVADLTGDFMLASIGAALALALSAIFVWNAESNGGEHSR